MWALVGQSLRFSGAREHSKKPTLRGPFRIEKTGVGPEVVLEYSPTALFTPHSLSESVQGSFPTARVRCP